MLEIILSKDKLSKKSEEVRDFENKDKYIDLIDQIVETGLNQKAYAVSAPQFGIFKRFIVMINTNEFKDEKCINVETYFNPKIVKAIGNQAFYEYCLSVPGKIGKVNRPYYIEFNYQDIDGNFKFRTAEGFEAIVFCHEIDHLDGIEYTDKVLDLIDNIDEEKKLRIREMHPREIYSKDGEFNQNDIDEKYRTIIYNSIEN